MRNLKKVLSLVLALAMVLSICMVGAGAVNYDDFTDEESIVKKQAVETLVSLDIIKGYNDGATFNPTGNVTRAEMATMICRVLAGGDNMIVDATKPVATYADIDGHWAESYIEYCTSLGIVSGKSPSSFDPQADVTAAEAAKMVMTTLGYNADIEGFKGIGWDINVMAKANTLQLLDNLQGEISSSVPMTREQVAQLLFNALDDPMVQNYVGTSANLWIGSGANAYQQTLLESKFKAEKVVGVVVANEWADLDHETPLGKGRTRVIVLGTDNMPTKTELTLNLTTGLDKIGESIIVYRDTNSNRIIFGDYQDTGLNQITEFTTYTKDITKGEGAVDKSAKDAAQYVNFSDGVITGSTYNASARFTVRLPGGVKYATDAENATDTSEFAIEETFNRNGAVSFDAYTDNANVKYDDRVATSRVLTILEAAYDEVNHNSETTAFLTNADNYDTFEDWCDVYLNSKTSSTTFDATANENGNYIKVVDYNNDGDIDYVLKTVYTASTVKRIAKDGEITLTDTIGVETDCNYIVTSGNNKTALTSEDELAAGDVVLYTVIDGTAYITLAETLEHVRIDKVHRNDITVTTVDGDTYNESGVIMVFKVDAMDDLGGVTGKGTDNDEEHSIIDMEGKTDYDLFFDLYGNIVAYRTSLNSGTFTLLTDGWFAAWKDGNEYAVKAFIDGKVGTYDVDRGGSTFVKGDKDNTVNNSWGQLKQFGDADGTTDLATNAGYTYITTVASYAQGEDSIDLTAVDQVNKSDRRNVDVVSLDVVDIKKGDNKFFTGDAYESGVNTAADADNYTYFKPATYLSTSEINKGMGNQNENVRVRPRTDTVYYYVYKNGSKLVVDTYEGYTNAPSVNKENISGMYAVGTEYGDYYIANVIVVELDRYLTGGELIFVYDAPEAIDQVGKDRFDIIRKDGTAEEGVIINHTGVLKEGKLYVMYEDGENFSVNVADEVDTAEEFKKHNLYIGTVDRWVDGVREKDYVWITPKYSDATHDDAVAAGATAEKRLELTGDKYYTLGYDLNRQGEWVADLKQEDANDVMAERRGQNADMDNNVLVYAKDNGQVIWAVSFNPDEIRVPNDEHAQDLWSALRPAYVTGGGDADYDAILAAAKVVADDKGATKTKAEIETQIKAVQDIFNKLTTYEQMALARQLVDRNNDGNDTVNDGSLFDALQKALGIANVDEFVQYVLEQEGLTMETRALKTDAAKTLAAAKTLKDAIIALPNTADDDLKVAIEALFKFTPATTTPVAAAATWAGDTTMIRDIVLGAVEDKLIALVGDNAEIAAVKTAISGVVDGIAADYATKNVATDKLILGIDWTIDAAGTSITVTKGAGDSTALTSTTSAVGTLDSALGTAETNKENKVVVGDFSGLTNLTVKVGSSTLTNTGTTISGKNPGTITLNLANGGAAAETYILTLTDASGNKADPVTQVVANGANEDVALTVGSGTWNLTITQQVAATVTVVSANCTVTNADGIAVTNGGTMSILTGTSATITVVPATGYTVDKIEGTNTADKPKVTVVKGTNENEWVVTPSDSCSITVTTTQIGAADVADAKTAIGTATSGDNAVIVSSNGDASEISTALAADAIKNAVKAKVDALTLDGVEVTGYEVKDSSGSGSYSAPASQGDTLDATVKVALKSSENAACTDTADVTVSVRWLHTAATMKTALNVSGLTDAKANKANWDVIKTAIVTAIGTPSVKQPNGTDDVTLVANSVTFVASSDFATEAAIDGSTAGNVSFTYKVQYGDTQLTIEDAYVLT